MNKFIILVLTALFAGCGVRVKTDPLKMEPVQVNHTVTINTAQLNEFFTTYCEASYSTQQEIDDCVAKSLATFWLAIENSIDNGNVQPSQGE